MTAVQPEIPEESPLPVDAPAESEASPEAVARALQALLQEKEEELAAAKDQTLRALAEVENTRRRGEREIADIAKYAVTGFARDLVSVIENLQRAMEAIPDELKQAQPAVATLATGVEMTMNELLSIFERHGIKRLNPMGQKFDHNFHQAVAQIDTPDTPAGTVVQVLQAGYTIHDRLLRPAMVGVAAGATKQLDTSA